MKTTFTTSETEKIKNTSITYRRNTLSALVGGLCCVAIPAWADCNTVKNPNENGGVNVICRGSGSIFENSLVGYGGTNSFSNNVVTAQGVGTTVLGDVWGGYVVSSTGNVSAANNAVTSNDNSIINGNVYGAQVYSYGPGDVSVTNNTVTLNGDSSANYVYGGDGQLANGTGDVSVTNNTLTFNGNSKVIRYTYGGVGITQVINGTGDIFVTNNTITFNDNSTAGAYVYGGYGYGLFGTGDMSITNNSVTLNDNSAVDGDIYGGYRGYGNGTRNISVTNNTITLNDNSTVSEALYGGYGYGTGNVSVTNNTVTLNDNSTVSEALYGGYVKAIADAGKADAFSGNTLNFATAPVTVNDTVTNFETYNFTLAPTLANTNTALITASTITFGTNEFNMKNGEDKNSKIRVVGIKAGNELFINDKFILMKAIYTMTGNAEGLITKGIAQQGISLLYDVETTIDTDGKQVTATITGREKPADPVDPGKPVDPVDPGKPAASVNPQLKSLSEGHLASAMMLTRGADTLAYNTVHTIQHQNPQKGLAPFITLSGDKTRYNTGSHINAKDGRLTGGLSYLTDNLVSAVIIENGWGSYGTHNSVAGMKDVNGDGHNRYTGAAVLGHYDFDSGIFAEASLRAGKNRNTFDTRDIQNLSTGEYARYNLDSNYLGTHIGAGYTWTLDEKNTADVSAKYLWAQLKGKNIKVAGDNIRFDDINSHRVRLDAGLSHQYTGAVAVRAGLGYEYEFDGKAKASTHGYDIAAPSVQGSTGILTLGGTVIPLAAQPLSIDVNLNGYTGKRDGVGGSVKFSYAF